jgi:hypothetical protein
MPIDTCATAIAGAKVAAVAIAATASADFVIILIVVSDFGKPLRRHDAAERSLGAAAKRVAQGCGLSDWEAGAKQGSLRSWKRLEL